MRVAALYIRGRIVVGRCHLDAFEQLSEEEKCAQDISSGFLNEETGEFSGYEAKEHFFNKKIMLMRHGKSHQDDLDPALCDQGIEEIHSLVQQLNHFDLTDFVGYTSPLLRCLMTAEIVAKATGLRFSVHPRLMENPYSLEPEEVLYIESRRHQFPNYEWPVERGWDLKHETKSEFRERTLGVLKTLPSKAILVSHRGVVLNMAKLALCDEKVMQHGIPTASLTYIDNREVKCLGKTTCEDNC